MPWKFIRVVITLLLLVSSPVQAQTLIAHPEQEHSQLSRTSLRAMFAVRLTQWPDGTPVRVFVLKDNNPTHIQFCKSVLGMFPYQLRKIWDRQVFSGTGIEPTVLDSEQEMLSRVAKTKGAIGYLENNSIDDSVKQLRTTP